MVDCVQTWRKKLRLQELVDIAKNELESGTEISEIYEILDKAMSFRWKLVNSTKKLYLEDVKKILANQFVLVM
ncbi:MAG: hypothetical protein OER78_03670 [Nitrosopumilus sp.]|nr:hypothetical protein [Nitrosopumilus sp.]